MKKEVLVAILIGLTMGLVITYGVYRIRTSLTDPPTSDVIEVSPTTDDETASVVSLHSPEDESVQTEQETTVAGTTLPNAFVVVFVNDNHTITSSDESGNFSTTAQLDNGANVIRVHVLDETGEAFVKERVVVVSDIFDSLENGSGENSEESSDESEATDEEVTFDLQKVGLAQTTSPDPDADTDGNTSSDTDDDPLLESDEETKETLEEIRKRIEKTVEEKSEEVKGVIDDLNAEKRGFIGEVTRVTDDSITTSATSGTVIIPVEEGVTLLKAGKEVGPSDIEVENWVTVLGTQEDDTFVPVFVLVSTETLRPKPQVVTLGTITQISSSSMTVQARFDQAQITFSLKSGTSFEDTNNEEIDTELLTENTNVLVIGVGGEDSITATTVRSLVAASDLEE